MLALSSATALDMPIEPEATAAPNAADDPLAALARAAANGDVGAFEALYRHQHRRLFGAIWRITGGVEARAEELLQEAFLRAWKALPGFRFESAVSTWLHRLAVNTALMDLRSRREAEDLEIDDSLLELHSAPRTETDRRMDLEAAVAQLPDRARAVLVLHDIEGLTHQEIGESLGIAAGSCKAHLHRARQHLRRLLGEENGYA